jgi:hypothetical protein
VLRRGAPGGQYEEIFRRKDHAAALTKGDELDYTYEDAADHTRRFERYKLEAGVFKRL